MLAGRRSADDPLALADGAPHRALLSIEGEPMLARVVDVLLAWPTIERVLINIDAPDLLDSIDSIAAHRAAGRVDVIESTDSPSLSVLSSLAVAGLDVGPVLVTTADHALLDHAMLDAFFAASLGEAPSSKVANTDAPDLTVGLVPRTVIRDRFPEARRTYLHFRGESYSGANLFLFRTPHARVVAEFWRRIESERKKPWRIAQAFGLTNLLLFLLRRLDLDAALARASRVLGARVRGIVLPIAEAAVDVDKIEDLVLVRAILEEQARSH